LQPKAGLAIGLNTQAVSRIKYSPGQEPVTSNPNVTSGNDAWSAVLSKIQQGLELHDKFSRSTNQRNETGLLLRRKKRPDEWEEDNTYKENEISLWLILEDTTQSDDELSKVRVQYEERSHDGVQLRPDIDYCIGNTTHSEGLDGSQTDSGESNSEDDSSSNE
ncbi:hypothetical protein CWC16_20045, partial [Pseudoalteromonas sp. S3776]|uniref:hypothetical protein n=1 Tax=Pseudoalteromonas sp. S3776 TaxID=579544 RepID=UPI00127AF8FC